MQTAIATLGFAVVALLAILERLYGMWLCRKAFQAGRGVHWKGGLRPSVDIDVEDRVRSPTALQEGSVCPTAGQEHNNADQDVSRSFVDRVLK